MGWGEPHATPASASMARSGELLRRLDRARRSIRTGARDAGPAPDAISNSPYPPAPPVIQGVTVTRPLNLRGGR